MIPTKPEEFARLVCFIDAREKLRCRKAARLTPWTQDQILSEFHFCNIDREQDYVTRWVRKHVSQGLRRYPFWSMVVQLLVCRIFNEPEVLVEVLPYRTRGEFAAKMGKRYEAKKPMFRGAYMTPPHGTETPAYLYYAEAVQAAGLTMRREFSTGQPDRLQDVGEALLEVLGIGDFVANQVCADLRHTYTGWTDSDTFVWCGAGTKRGLNRLAGRPVKASLPKAVATEHVLDLRQTLLLYYASNDTLWRALHDPNNVSNALCEFDKYRRAQDQITAGEEPSLRRRYTPNPKRT